MISQLKKTKPIQKRAKIDVNVYSTKDYENEPRFRPAGKQTQTKPISNGAPGSLLANQMDNVR